MKNEKKFILGIFVFIISFLIRLLFSIRFTTPWVGDEPVWFAYSVNVFNNHFYGTNGAYVAPGFPFFSGFLFKLFGKPPAPDITVIEIANTFLGAFTATFIYMISSRLFKSNLTGFLSGLLYAFLPAAILYTGMNYSETLWVFFVFLAIWLTFKSIENKHWLLYILSGISYGLSALTRPTSLPLALFSIILFSSIGIKRKYNWKQILLPPVLIIAFTFLTILPWTIRNYYVYKELVLIDINSGINLYLAHNEKSNGYWIDMGVDDPVIKLGDRPQVDKLGKKLALDYIKAHPEKTLKQAYKVNYLFWFDENSDIQRFGIYKLKLLQKLFPFKLLAFLGIIGIIISAKKYWRQSLWIIVYMVAYNGLIAFMYFAPRYRYAIEPFLTIFAGYPIFLLFKAIFLCAKKFLPIQEKT